MTTTPAAVTHTLEVPGATLHYEVRGELGPETLLLIGSPMDADGFHTLATYFTDRPVVTYDPRGVTRSTRTDVDGTVETTPQQHASDLHHLIEALGVGPVDLFASSGGAVNALALVQAHPDDVRTLVAHEPPLSHVQPDPDAARAAVNDIYDTYQAKGQGHAMAKFIALVMHTGPLAGPMPDIDPAQFGMPAEDDGKRDDILIGQNLRNCTSFVPDYVAIAAAPTRVVAAYGVGSADQLAANGARGVARQLGIEPTEFPSDHGGFLGGEFGQHGDPEAFGPRLREVLG